VNAEFSGQAGPTASPFVVADWHDDLFVVAANLGARVRQSEEDGNLDVGSAFTYGAGGAVRAGALPVWVGAGRAGAGAGGAARGAPLGRGGGVRGGLGGGFAASAGYGRGLVPG